MTQSSKTQPLTEDGYLSGQLLIAMPAMADDRFARSVVFLCAHTPDGAMGLIVNKPATHIKFPDLLDQLDILADDEGVADNDEIHISEKVEDLAVHIGGPVETGRGFVLHSSDYYGEDSTMQIDDIVSLTATIDILRAIASGDGPDRALLALGYAGWAPGQLDSEIRANGWLHCAPDSELLFGINWAEKYDLALSKVGVDPSRLVSDAGHA